MRFEWDEAKNRINQSKHGIAFSLAQLVFDDPFCVTFEDRFVDGEQRWLAIGSIEGAVIVIVAHTFRERDSQDVIRLISARRATRHERSLYAQANQ